MYRILDDTIHAKSSRKDLTTNSPYIMIHILRYTAKKIGVQTPFLLAFHYVAQMGASFDHLSTKII